MEKNAAAAAKTVKGLQQQFKSMAKTLNGILENVSLSDLLGQTQKVVRRTTTTVRKETKKVLADFDKLNRLETEKISTTITTSVTTTTEKNDLAETAERLSKTSLSPLVAGFTALQGAITAVAGVLQQGMVQVLNFVAGGLDTLAQKGLALVQYLVTVAENLRQSIMNVFMALVGWFAEMTGTIRQHFAAGFEGVAVLAENVRQKIMTAWTGLTNWFASAVVGPLGAAWSGLCGNFATWAGNAWNAVCSAFAGAAGWFDGILIRPVGEQLRTVLSSITDWAVSVWGKVRNTFSGMVTFFKELLNGVIATLNNALSGIFASINSILSSLRNIRILGKQPISGIQSIPVPRIPYLAQGAVLPANKPFLAMVGDQRHGTNVEAPLSTIQEAVAAVMEDMVSGSMAGQEAVLSVLRQILEAVLGISISDSTLYEAVDRHRRNMAVMHGGGQLWY